MGLYALLAGKSRQQAAEQCSAMGWGTFKPLLAEAAVEALRPLQQRYQEWRQQPGAVAEVLRNGQHKAAAVADETLKRVRETLGFLSPA